MSADEFLVILFETPSIVLAAPQRQMRKASFPEAKATNPAPTLQIIWTASCTIETFDAKDIGDL
jgi:hypothetical protein